MSRTHCFVSGDVVYHMAIIDFLQEWNFNKKGERCMKTVLLRKDPDTLSAIEPIRYSERFQAFCDKKIFARL